MKKHAFHPFLFLLLAIGLLSWPGCDDDDDPAPDCDLGVFQLNFGDYCDPELLAFRDLGNPGLAINDLPDYCSADYSLARTMLVEVPVGGKIYVHQYRDFPADVAIEFIGTNCQGTDYELIECSSSSSIVNTFEIDATNFSNVIIRAVPTANTNYQPGTREEDELTFAAFTEPFVPVIANRQSENPVTLDCQGRPNRLILSPGPDGVNPLSTVGTLGLPFEECGCDQNLVSVDVPPGVDLNTLRPKVPKEKPEADTSSTSFDLLIGIPQIVFSNDVPPAEDPAIGGNECLLFQEPGTSSSANEGLRVTIVDSGIDLNNWGSIFSNNQNYDSPACLPAGPYGYDFLNNSADPFDQVGHGTYVASAFLSSLNASAPVTLVSYKFFGPDGGSLFDGLCATSTAITEDSDVINLSWGFSSKGIPAALEYVLSETQDKNVIVVTSAGNDFLRDVQVDPQYYPAAAGDAFNNLIVVASHTQLPDNSPSLTSFTNVGEPAVSLAAIYSTECLELGGGFAYPAGTSISAPIVTRKVTETAATQIGGTAEGIINDFYSNQTSTDPNMGDIRDERFLPVPNPSFNCGFAP